MRRDALDRAIKAVHWKVPKYLFKRCHTCNDDVKGEQMWWVRKQSGGGICPPVTWKSWTCRRCAPLMSDLFKAEAVWFDKNFGILDLTCIEEEERQLGLHIPIDERYADADV
jgi:hypothetical protein